MAYISSEPIKTELYFPVDILRGALPAFSHCGNVLLFSLQSIFDIVALMALLFM